MSEFFSTMQAKHQISLGATIDILRALGEPTRFRILVLLSHGDLTVTDLIEILGQSQPRISRHLKLLSEAGLLERYQEGAWAYFRVVDRGTGAFVVKNILSQLELDDLQIFRDRQRLDAVRQKRAERANKYFARNAEDWGNQRSLYADDTQVEAAMTDIVGSDPIQAMLDLGTGTGRLLELFSDLFVRGVGVDASRDMLAVARSAMDKAGLSQVQVRQGDITNLPTAVNEFDLVTLHQVLHYMDDPMLAIREAANALAPGGRLLIVDFAPHSRDDLRELHAHVRLGFSMDQMAAWLDEVNLEPMEVRHLNTVNPDSNEELLTVTLWLARDKRMLIADNDAISLANTGTV